MARTGLDSVIIDLNEEGAAQNFVVGDLDYATVSAAPLSGSWATAVLTIERTNDQTREAWYALESDTTIPAGGGMTAKIDVRGVLLLRARVSTTEGSAGKARVSFFGQGE